ncbi:hypothetical protein AB0J80_09520 [Actinoplanes sp. NPDC049548]|uniref:hypothetical protein n=1 Tax=Actinoplanes sp. NPDC049548 TaxID=3155152 RepID=UPI0034232134
MTDSRTRTTNARCLVGARVDRIQLLWDSATTDDARPVAEHLGCELVAGHGGDHAALVATADGGDQWWWLRWDERRETIVQIDPCVARSPRGRYADDCFLPQGHPGSHSFALRPLISPG